MKKKLIFQKFKKYVIHENYILYYAIDYINQYALLVKNPMFGETLPIEITTTCIENTEGESAVEITKEEFVVEYKKAVKLLRDVNIVIR